MMDFCEVKYLGVINHSTMKTAISNGIMFTNDVYITPTIIRQALRKLIPGKVDRDCGFKSDYLLYSTHRFYNNNNNNKLFIRTYQYGLIEHISYKS